MKARARLLGHPVHQMFIVFPLGLLATSVIFDVVALVTEGQPWPAVAYWTLTAGLIGAALAAPFGLIDWLAIPRGTRARRIGAAHGLGNGLVTLLFFASWLLRTPMEVPGTAPLTFSFAAAALALVTAWLGGELVSRLGIGVDDRAGVDAPSSLHTS
jgi:uncharacterized membrane protein